jgi:nitroreductase
MYKEKITTVLLVLFLGTKLIFGQTANLSAIDLILNGYSVKMFTSVPVSDNDIDLILKCGMKAPSARNLQPWKFTVVKDQTICGEIIPNITPGNILIIISGQTSGQDGKINTYDCGLATQNMYIATQSLGLGAHIYASPVSDINSTKKQILEIPDGYMAVSILRVGNIDKNVDAASSASTRKKPEEVINYK